MPLEVLNPRRFSLLQSIIKLLIVRDVLLRLLFGAIFLKARNWAHGRHIKKEMCTIDYVSTELCITPELSSTPL